ncbi:hypothetical protein BDN70DRAFT_874100 [Pholiota conissans]|uniref:TEA domain-containing protein n=1 Tax=Pholiota conissans TaxID=109636 RepID=A0A9P6D4L7_9AGAR|nr:hypothetical protein BDN70DRAFT_874100 [Pholiota conissans]
MHTRNIGPSSFLTQTDTNILLSPSERTGRKSYKLSNRKGGEKKEPVWPPQLEAALLEGLRKYKPISKSGRPLRRFTKRNVSIARHIFATTGKTRTAKQVGSRLQQITESTKDEEIIKLITSRELVLDDSYSSYSQGDSGASDSYSSTPTIMNTPGSSVTTSEAGSPEVSVHVDQVSLFAQLVSADTTGPAAFLGLDADIPRSGINLYLNVDPAEGYRLDGNSLSNARRLSNIPSSHLFDDIPKLTISSPLLSPLFPHICMFTVYRDAVKAVHSEQVSLVAIKPESSLDKYTYIAPLLPSYWDTLVHRTSIERYTVMLEILELDRGVATLETGRRKFSIAINVKLNSPADEPVLHTSCAPYYPSSSAYDDIHIHTEYPDLPLANHLPTASYLPELPLQMSSNFQNGAAMAAWNDNNYFIPATTYVQYPDLGDTRFETHLESDHPSSYLYPSF